jgi:hypothetical protein
MEAAVVVWGLRGGALLLRDDAGGIRPEQKQEQGQDQR